MKIPAVIADNAMMYKDLTQWMRNKTFQVFFIGLLILCQIVSTLVVTIPTDTRELGGITFTILCILLGVYTFGILGGATTLTTREFQEKTFELYEMAGMSLERMVFGKFLSMLVQFAFGFFCIVPFMFFSYLLGGLDFSIIFLVPLIGLVAVIPLYLLGLLLSLLTKNRKIQIGGAGRVIGPVIFLIFVLPWLATMVISVIFRSFHGSSPFSSFASSISFTPDFFLFLGIALLFYVQLCLLLFYLCCGAISRSNDSREVQIKGFLFTLIISWLAVCISSPGPSDPQVMAFVAFIPASALALISGLVFYLNRLDVPNVVRKRYREAGPIRRRIYRFCEPGARGGCRSQTWLLGIMVICAGILYLRAVGLPGYKPEYFMHPISVALQIPFFIALPGGFILLIRKMNDKIKSARTLTVIIWILLGVVFSITVSVLTATTRGIGYDIIDPKIEFVGIILSPISSFGAGLGHNSTIRETAWIVRIILGLIGLYMMRSLLSNRLKAAPKPPLTLKDTERSL